MFGHFDDRIGRERMLVVSLLIMGVGTSRSACCRLSQGFAVGGEWGGAVLMVAEHGDPRRRGFWSSWPQAGVPAAVLVVVGLWIRLSWSESSVYQQVRAELERGRGEQPAPALRVVRSGSARTWR